MTSIFLGGSMEKHEFSDRAGAPAAGRTADRHYALNDAGVMVHAMALDDIRSGPTVDVPTRLGGVNRTPSSVVRERLLAQ